MRKNKTTDSEGTSRGGQTKPPLAAAGAKALTDLTGVFCTR